MLLAEKPKGGKRYEATIYKKREIGARLEEIAVVRKGK